MLTRRKLINQAISEASELDPEWGKPKDYGKTTLPLYQTDPRVVADCLKLVPFDDCDVVLDVGSGNPKVFYEELKNYPVERYECEIQDGVDFFTLPANDNARGFDWCIGNPPFEKRWSVIEHAAKICTKGFAFIFNQGGLNALTPKRRQVLQDLGWYQHSQFIFSDKRWFGRYSWLVFTKTPNTQVSWHLGTYK